MTTNRRPQPGPRARRDALRHLSSARGMTLVEILVVLAIVAGIMGIGVSVVGVLTNGDLKRDATRLTAAIKYTYNQAALNNTRYRLVIDLDQNTYYSEVVESALVEPPSVANKKGDDDLMTEEARKLAEKRKKETDLYDEDEENPFGISRRVSYKKVQDGVIKPGKLNDGNKLLRVFVRSAEAIEEGKAYINFFPNGYQEPAIIVMQNTRGSFYSLQTEGFTGRVFVRSAEVTPDPEFGEVEEQDDR